jgi:hypothetical protein
MPKTFRRAVFSVSFCPEAFLSHFPPAIQLQA